MIVEDCLTMKKISISQIDYGVVAFRPMQMYAWPGLVKISNNELLAAASERRGHLCPYGREVIMRSYDGGKSWSLPQEVYNSELDDRDSNLLLMPGGNIMLSFFTATAFANSTLRDKWGSRAERVTEKMRKELLGTWTMTSDDNGINWSQPCRMPVGQHISPVLLSDNSLLTIGQPWDGSNNGLLVYKSIDAGASWHKAGKIACKQIDGNPILNENHILETFPGRLIALFRSDPYGDGYIYQASSCDFGVNWTVPVKTEIWGYPPHLLRLSNGAIMCSYSHRRSPVSIRAVFSYDNGLSWDMENIQTIYQWPDNEWEKPEWADMGYPISVELEPNHILTIFYCNRYDIVTSPEKKYPGFPRGIDTKPNGILSAKYTLEQA